MSQARLLISVFLRLTFVSGWFVFSHVTSQAFDFCVFEIDVCEWVVRGFFCFFVFFVVGTIVLYSVALWLQSKKLNIG